MVVFTPPNMANLRKMNCFFDFGLHFYEISLRKYFKIRAGNRFLSCP